MQDQSEGRFGISTPRLTQLLGCDLTDDCPSSNLPVQTIWKWSWMPLGFVKFITPAMYSDVEWFAYWRRFASAGDSETVYDKAMRNHPARKILNALRGRRLVGGRNQLDFAELEEGWGVDEEINELGNLIGKRVVPVTFGNGPGHSYVLVAEDGRVYMLSAAACGIYFCGRQVCEGLENVIDDSNLSPVFYEDPRSPWRMPDQDINSEKQVDWVDLQGIVVMRRTKSE